MKVAIVVNEAQIAFALELLKKHPSEEQVFIKGNGHMYFHIESALLSVGGDKSKLALITKDGEVKAVEDEKPVKAKEVSLTPDLSWKLDDLKAYAEKIGLNLEPGDKSKVAVLEKIKTHEEAAANKSKEGSEGSGSTTV